MQTKHQTLAVVRTTVLVVAAVAALLGYQMSVPASAAAQTDTTAPKRMVTQGPAKAVVENMYQCPVTVENYRPSGVGQITATDGTVITMPAVTAFQKGLGPKSVDLFNECTQVTPQKSADVSTAKVPVIEVDRDGEEITGFIVADNYYELRVNGTHSL